MLSWLVSASYNPVLILGGKSVESEDQARIFNLVWTIGIFPITEELGSHNLMLKLWNVEQRYISINKQAEA